MPDPTQIKEHKSLKMTGDLLSVARTPNTQQLWIGSNDAKIYFVDLAVEKPEPTGMSGHTSYVSGLVQVDNVLISCGWDKKLIWWNLENREPTRTVVAHQKWIRQLVASPDRQLIATVSDDMSCKLWDAKSGQIIRELRGHQPIIPRFDYPNKLYTCAFSPDGKLLAAADELCQVIVWDVGTGQVATRFEAAAFYKSDWDRNNHPWGGVRTMAFSPDGKRLALGGMQNTDVAIINGPGFVQVFDWAQGKSLHEYKLGTNLQFESVAFHPRTEWLLTASGGGATRMAFLDIESGKTIHEFDPKMQTFGLALDEAAETIYTVGRERVAVWRLT